MGAVIRAMYKVRWILQLGFLLIGGALLRGTAASMELREHLTFMITQQRVFCIHVTFLVGFIRFYLGLREGQGFITIYQLSGSLMVDVFGLFNELHGGLCEGSHLGLELEVLGWTS